MELLPGYSSEVYLGRAGKVSLLAPPARQLLAALHFRSSGSQSLAGRMAHMGACHPPSLLIAHPLFLTVPAPPHPSTPSMIHKMLASATTTIVDRRIVAAMRRAVPLASSATSQQCHWPAVPLDSSATRFEREGVSTWRAVRAAEKDAYYPSSNMGAVARASCSPCELRTAAAQDRVA